jgi:nondiscriminating glutamyl-tRNA synthetase
MGDEEIPESSAERTEEARPEARFTGGHIAAILRERGWMGSAEEETPDALRQWLDRAALLLGPKAADRQQLVALLEAVFHYDAREILDSTEAHVVLARAGARTVIRELGREVIGGRDVDSDRLKEIFDRVKERTGYRGRELFHPLRLALAGRAGEGELDRVILLVDNAARLPFAVKVKTARERMLEFCGQLD